MYMMYIYVHVYTVELETFMAFVNFAVLPPSGCFSTIFFCVEQLVQVVGPSPHFQLEVHKKFSPRNAIFSPIHERFHL